MRTVTFTAEEAARLARHSRWLGLDGPRPVPVALLRAFLVGRLAGTDPDLARKVSELPDDGVERLRAELRDGQAFARSLVFG